MIPSSSSYPASLDSVENLYEVHDALRVRLLEDYNPGDTSIQIDGDNSNFPDSGLITLTEQCSDIGDRALTFWYASKTSTSFAGLIIDPYMTDTAKPKRLTNVVQNVMSDHHNNLKNALIAIENFIGIQGTTDLKPLGATMEGRINFLRNLVLRPRAWFTSDKRIGIAPLTVTFTDLSFRNPTEFIWDFGDNTSSIISEVHATSVVPNISNISVIDDDGGTITKTYGLPGIYTVKLTVQNEFGQDVCQFADMIQVRTNAPDEASIQFIPGAGQTTTHTDDPFLSTHLSPGILNARSDQIIDIEVTDNGEQPLDPVMHYTWKLGDDLNHTDSSTAKASYGIGGLYDVRLRVDSKLGSYRWTIFPDAINIIEKQNLFLMLFDPGASGVTQSTTSYEFGLLSETFKTNNRNSTTVTRDYTFLDSGAPNYSQALREFLRNNGFAPRGTQDSGDMGEALVYWSEGGSPISAQNVNFVSYQGFSDTWSTPTAFEVNQPWNWVGFNSNSAVYLAFGATSSVPAVQVEKTTVNLSSLVASQSSINDSNFINGADELKNNVGDSTTGYFSVYRSCWRGSQGFFLRNDGVGNFFRIKNFYQVDGTISTPFLNVTKLTDIPGSPKLEGQLVPLTDGVYFFNNTGEIAFYNPNTSTWQVGGPGVNSAAFRSLQDSSVSGFDSESNTLVAASDGDQRVYLSYDYSPNAFIQFNEAESVFRSLTPRPSGSQFLAGIF